MEAGIFLTGMIEDVSEFVDSNVIATFLIAMGIVIVLGVVYGTKLWYDIREVKKVLDEMEKGEDSNLA